MLIVKRGRGWIQVLLTAIFLIGVVMVDEAQAHDKKHKNLKVLPDIGKKLGKGMKQFTKGLGVKCKACHVKGKYESDKPELKIASRKFIKIVWEGADEATRAQALKVLLTEMKLDKAKNEAKIWAGFDIWRKAAAAPHKK